MAAVTAVIVIICCHGAGPGSRPQPHPFRSSLSFVPWVFIPPTEACSLFEGMSLSRELVVMSAINT